MTGLGGGEVRRTRDAQSQKRSRFAVYFAVVSRKDAEPVLDFAVAVSSTTDENNVPTADGGDDDARRTEGAAGGAVESAGEGAVVLRGGCRVQE